MDFSYCFCEVSESKRNYYYYNFIKYLIVQTTNKYSKHFLQSSSFQTVINFNFPYGILIIIIIVNFMNKSHKKFNFIPQN